MPVGRKSIRAMRVDVAVFRQVENHPGYWISDEGHLLGRNGRRIAKKPNRWGYCTAQLGLGGSRVQVHRLVLEAFVGPCPAGMECRHLDGDGANNRLSNLAWGTPKENSADRTVHGTQVRGEQLSSLTRDDVLAIIKDPRTHGEIGAAYGVAGSTIASIKARQSWAWLTDGHTITNSPVEHGPIGDDVLLAVKADGRSAAVVAKSLGLTQALVFYIRARHPDYPRPRVGGAQAKVTESDVRSIRRAVGTYKSIGARFGVSSSTVHLIKTRARWSHVGDTA